MPPSPISKHTTNSTERDVLRTEFLLTPSVPLLVAEHVFDAFAWNTSTQLEWRTLDATIELNALDPDLPERMAFVLREPWSVLPVELARLHVGKAYGLRDEVCLAPYGIDDATDQLFEHRRDAHQTFWLATSNLNALFWALHDWAHFHNHGPFEDRTATEYQCDVSALVWLWINRQSIPLHEDRWEELRSEVLAVHRRRLLQDPPAAAINASLMESGAALRAFGDEVLSITSKKF